MCGNILCIAAVVLGVEAGWQPMPDGGVQYLIQIEPHMLDSLRSGEAVESDIPPAVKEVRGYRITVGTETLPRELPPALAPEFDSASVPNTLPSNPTTRPIVEPAAAIIELDANRNARRAASSPQPAWNPGDEQPNASQKEPKPWMPLMFTLFVLFASLGGNAYLLWIAIDFRARYRTVVLRSHGV